MKEGWTLRMLSARSVCLEAFPVFWAVTWRMQETVLRGFFRSRASVLTRFRAAWRRTTIVLAPPVIDCSIPWFRSEAEIVVARTSSVTPWTVMLPQGLFWSSRRSFWTRGFTTRLFTWVLKALARETPAPWARLFR
jgi:hypothetical protein